MTAKLGASSGSPDRDLPSHPGRRHRTPLGILVSCFVLVSAAGFLASTVTQQRAELAGVRAQLDRFSSEVARAKLDLGKVTAKAADLQDQLDRARIQRVALQAELAQALE